jgi:hypothetical protein
MEKLHDCYSVSRALLLKTLCTRECKGESWLAETHAQVIDILISDNLHYYGFGRKIKLFLNF